MSKPLLFLIALASVVLAVLLLTTSSPAGALDNVDGCSLSGAARGGEKAEDNRLKNRYTNPAPSDFDTAVSLSVMLAAHGNDLDSRRAARVTGYVKSVREGGVESCNCKATDPAHRDTHFEIVPAEGADEHLVVVTEVTPRTRILARQGGLDWTTEALKHDYLGKKVVVEGWLYYDPDHADQSYAEDPNDENGRSNWRGSSWEIHPITKISLAGN